MSAVLVPILNQLIWLPQKNFFKCDIHCLIYNISYYYLFFREREKVLICVQEWQGEGTEGDGEKES